MIKYEIFTFAILDGDNLNVVQVNTDLGNQNFSSSVNPVNNRVDGIKTIGIKTIVIKI